MKVLLDTNIVLDLLLEREPFCNEAKNIFQMIESDEIIDKLLQLFNIADVNKNILIKSLKNNGKDFEDSVIYTSAEYFNIDVIITRDKKGFKQSNIKVLKANDFLEEYKLLLTIQHNKTLEKNK